MSIETTPDGQVRLRVDRFVTMAHVIELNGCVPDPLHRTDIDLFCPSNNLCRSGDLRPRLYTGTSKIGLDVGLNSVIDVTNDRTVTFGKPRIVTQSGGARVIEIDYSMAVLTSSEVFHWSWRRPDGTLVSTSFRSAASNSFNPTATLRITIPVSMAGGGTFDMYISVGLGDMQPCPVPERYYASATIPPVTPAVEALDLNVGVMTDPGMSYTLQRAGQTTFTVEVALGTFFELALKKRQGFLEPVLDVLTGLTIGTKAVAPAFTYPRVHLTAEDPLVRLSASNSGIAHRFVAVHLGTTTMTLQPLSVTGAATAQVTIRVVKPVKLGTKANEWDDRVIEAAHERGVPPQYLKAQLRQESDFKAMSWRYEPCTWDKGIISTGKKLILKTPYSLFAHEAARGTTLLDRTIDVRNALYVPTRNDADEITGRRHVVTADRDVTASDLWIASDAWPVPGSNPPKYRGEKWSDHCKAFEEWREANPEADRDDWATDNLAFVAQTPTASSYGVMQIMYGVAIDFDFEATDPDTGEKSKDPYLLFDTTEHLSSPGAGSIPVGTARLVDKHKAQEQTTYDSRKSYQMQLDRMFRGYNWYYKHTQTKQYYHERVNSFEPLYRPTPPDVVIR